MADRSTEREPVLDRTHVDWFVERLGPWSGLARVGDWMPDGFERYGRLLHPAHHRDEGHVPWSRVAAWSGREVHSTMLFDDLATRADGEHWSSVGSRPADGELDRSIVARLASLFAEHTSTPDVSWYCIWSGHGGLDELEARAIEITPRISASGRRYILYRVPVREAEDLHILAQTFPLVSYPPWMRLVRGGFARGPNIGPCSTHRTSGGRRIEPGSFPRKWMPGQHTSVAPGS